VIFDNERINKNSVNYTQQDVLQEFLLIMLIVVSSFGESLRWVYLTALAEACFKGGNVFALELYKFSPKYLTLSARGIYNHSGRGDLCWVT